MTMFSSTNKWGKTTNLLLVVLQLLLFLSFRKGTNNGGQNGGQTMVFGFMHRRSASNFPPWTRRGQKQEQKVFLHPYLPTHPFPTAAPSVFTFSVKGSGRLVLFAATTKQGEDVEIKNATVPVDSEARSPKKQPNIRVRAMVQLIQAYCNFDHEGEEEVADYDGSVGANNEVNNGSGEQEEEEQQPRRGEWKEWRKLRKYLYNAEKYISMKQVEEVLIFLRGLPIDKETAKHVLQTAPRILKKPVATYLRPIANFLLELWGPELFAEGMKKKPHLLLIKGVGYTEAWTRRKTRTYSIKNETHNIHSASHNLTDVKELSRALSSFAMCGPNATVLGQIHQMEEKVDDANADEETVEELLIRVTNLSQTDIDKIKNSHPALFGREPTSVSAMLDFISEILKEGGIRGDKTINITAIGLELSNSTSPPDDLEELIYQDRLKTALGKVIKRYPFLLQSTVETCLLPRIEFLKTRCGFTVADIARVLQTAGGLVLSLSVEHNLKPTIDYLSSDHLLGGDLPALRKCILSHSQLLCLSVANLESKVNYFDMGIVPSVEGGHQQYLDDEPRPKALASRIFHRCPAVFSLSLEENLIPKIDFLAKVCGISNTVADRNKLLTGLYECPTILTLSLEGNLEQTMEFYNRTGYVHLDGQWNLQPGQTRIRFRYMLTSLYNRLLPRWYYCRKLGLENPPLILLAIRTDEVFCSGIGANLIEYEKYMAHMLPQIKMARNLDAWLNGTIPGGVESLGLLDI